MQNRVKLLLCVAVLLVMPFEIQAQDAPIVGTRLDISAQAELKAKSDTATIQASVVTRGDTANAARDANARLMQAAFKVLKAKKIADTDLQTNGLTINPDYNYSNTNAPPKITGYQAVNSLSVTLHDLTQTTDVIDALLQNGINQFNGPAFSIAEPEALLNGARQEAMKKAKARAEIYAQATGLKIKRIISISENTSMGNPQPYRMLAMAKAAAPEADAATPIATGQIGLDVTVNVSYELAN